MELAAVEQLLSESSLSCCATTFLALWLERAGFGWGFFPFVSVGISELPASSLHFTGIFEAKRKPRDSPTVRALGGPGQRTFPLCLFESFCVSLCIMSRVLVGHHWLMGRSTPHLPRIIFEHVSLPAFRGKFFFFLLSKTSKSSRGDRRANA